MKHKLKKHCLSFSPKLAKGNCANAVTGQLQIILIQFILIQSIRTFPNVFTALDWIQLTGNLTGEEMKELIKLKGWLTYAKLEERIKE